RPLTPPPSPMPSPMYNSASPSSSPNHSSFTAPLPFPLPSSSPHFSHYQPTPVFQNSPNGAPPKPAQSNGHFAKPPKVLGAPFAGNNIAQQSAALINSHKSFD